MNKLFIITLGCAKNRVDTEYIVADLIMDGWQITEKPENADVIAVNTCAFIEDSKIESIDTILELASIKQKHQKLTVLGCLPQRYQDELVESLPEVDIFVGTSSLDKFKSMLIKGSGKSYSKTAGSWIPTQFIPRTSSISSVSAYLKIAEGCNRQCAYCAVPGIRGKQQSFHPELLIKETKHLISSGIKEINLIAQDLTAYGKDIDTTLLKLLKTLDTIEFNGWYRLLYLYPSEVTSEILTYMKTSPHIVPYLDIPIQHISSSVLKTMRRGYNEKQVRDMLENISKTFGNKIFLRTTIITGHPGETQQDFDDLKKFIEKANFDHLGVFAYSPEEDTTAYSLSHPSKEIAEKRRNEIMLIQQEISKRKLESLKHKELPVLVENFEKDSLVWIGRHYGQAPEVDGNVFLTQTDTKSGEIINAKVVETSAYDLVCYK